MSDVIERIAPATVSATVPTAFPAAISTAAPSGDTAATQPWPAHMERRRPGRRNDVSPELIALMRRPTPEAVRAVALYDAPNFVLPSAPAGHAAITGRHVLRLTIAVAASGLVWAVAFRGMMAVWG